MSRGMKVRLVEGDHGNWAAIDEDLGVTTEGDTRGEALASLDEALERSNDAHDSD